VHSVVITGIPVAAASNTAFGNPSRHVGKTIKSIAL
jgi:hypothetical protein